jgi:hypothetical protein
MKRKQLIYLVGFLALMISIISCSKKDSSSNSYNDLSANIKRVIPEATYNAMMDLGMQIHTGTTPPNFANTYFVSPFRLKNSNISADNIGSDFADMTINYFNLNLSAYTVQINYLNGNETGTGIGGFISGSDNYFSVYGKINVMYGLDTADVAIVSSGKLVTAGIQDFYYALFMIDNRGNPSGHFIDNNQGRVFYDSDGMSEITSDIFLKKANDMSKSAGQK